MNEQPVRWGVVGCANIAINHVIPSMEGAALTTLTAIASRTLSKAQATAERFGIPKAYGSYEAMLADSEIDAVYIPLPNGLHAEWSIKAMRAGKHVLCEKPITVNAAEAREIEAVRSETGRYCLEAYASRFNPVQVKAVEIARSGVLGELRFVHTIASFLMENPDPADVRLQADIGGGALYDIGCYAVDAQRRLMGRMPVTVSARMQWSSRFDVDMAGVAMLDYGDGAMGTLQWGFNAPWGGPFSLVGVKGKLTGPYGWGAPSGEPAMLLQTGREAEKIMAGHVNGYTAEVQDLSEAVRGLHAPAFAAESLEQNMRIIDACYASRRSGQTEAV